MENRSAEKADGLQGQRVVRREEGKFGSRCLIFEVRGRGYERQMSVNRFYGGVAQLGEHLLCKQGVIGSIPFISTRAGRLG